ncbi:MAG: hypothetical protein ACJ731_10485 [Vicinamibacterales bacterium]
MRQLALALLLLVIASAFAFLLHRPTLSYGFDYDDYHFVRPYPRAELIAAFHGAWDPAGIERPYYRPLTISFYAARFEMLGINATAHHQLSLGLFSLAAALAGWFALRLTGSILVALLTTVIYILHPAMPYALVAWVTNQMHLLESIVVLTALIWWHAVRARGIVWWLPLLGFAVVAFLIKEDGIMLLPSILVLHVICRRIDDEGVPPAPREFIAAAVSVAFLLIGIRTWALAQGASERRPAAALALRTYVHGLNGVLRLVPADRRWQLAASWFVSLASLTAVLAWRRLWRGARLAMIGGLVIALLFNMPFVLITKTEQMHLVALGIVVLLAGACAGLLQAAPGWIVRSGIALACAAGLACLGAVSRDITRDFDPYGSIVLAHDDIVRGWAAVPADLREYLARKRLPGAPHSLSPDPSEALDSVTFGVHEWERSREGVRYRWMSSTRAEILIAQRVRTVTIPLRHAIEVFREPARVTITSDGRLVDDMILNTSDWRAARIAILPGVRPLSRMHRLVVAIDHAWRPADMIAGSQDGRTLGLQVGEVVVR